MTKRAQLGDNDMTKQEAMAQISAYGGDDGPETYEEAADLFRAIIGREPDDSDGDAGDLFSHTCVAYKVELMNKTGD